MVWIGVKTHGVFGDIGDRNAGSEGSKKIALIWPKKKTSPKFSVRLLYFFILFLSLHIHDSLLDLSMTPNQGRGHGSNSGSSSGGHQLGSISGPGRYRSAKNGQKNIDEPGENVLYS